MRSHDMRSKFKQFKELMIKKKEPLMTTSLLVLVLFGYQNCQEADEYYKLETSQVNATNINEPWGTPGTEQDSSGQPGGIAQDNDPEDKSLCEGGAIPSTLICNPLTDPPTNAGNENGPGDENTPPNNGSGDGDGANTPEAGEDKVAENDPTNPGDGNGNEDEDGNEPGSEIDIPSVPKKRLGLIGHIYEGQPQWNNIERYYIEGYRHPEEVYFSNFNVPRRSFNSGFGRANQFLKNGKGEKLIEWFAIKVNGHIALPQNQESGFYHITSTSDDGIQVIIDGNKIIDNPNTHAVTIDCAKNLVYLEKGKEVPFELNYFQGPRYHIALQLLIKKVDNPANFKNSSLCGKRSSTHTGLVKEGYKIITPPWFTLPNGY